MRRDERRRSVRFDDVKANDDVLNRRFVFAAQPVVIVVFVNVPAKRTEREEFAEVVLDALRVPINVEIVEFVEFDEFAEVSGVKRRFDDAKRRSRR